MTTRAGLKQPLKRFAALVGLAVAGSVVAVGVPSSIAHAQESVVISQSVDAGQELAGAEIDLATAQSDLSEANIELDQLRSEVEAAQTEAANLASLGTADTMAVRRANDLVESLEEGVPYEEDRVAELTAMVTELELRVSELQAQVDAQAAADAAEAAAAEAAAADAAEAAAAEAAAAEAAAEVEAAADTQAAVDAAETENQGLVDLEDVDVEGADFGDAPDDLLMVDPGNLATANSSLILSAAGIGIVTVGGAMLIARRRRESEDLD